MYCLSPKSYPVSLLEAMGVKLQDQWFRLQELFRMKQQACLLIFRSALYTFQQCSIDPKQACPPNVSSPLIVRRTSVWPSFRSCLFHCTLKIICWHQIPCSGNPERGRKCVSARGNMYHKVNTIDTHINMRKMR